MNLNLQLKLKRRFRYSSLGSGDSALTESSDHVTDQTNQPLTTQEKKKKEERREACQTNKSGTDSCRQPKPEVDGEYTSTNRKSLEKLY